MGLLLAAVLLAGCRAATDSRGEAAVRAVVEDYFAGMMLGDAERMERAFHPTARLIGMGAGGTMAIIPFREWAEVTVAEGPRGPEGFVNRIVSVDVHGIAASVKTELAWPDIRYVDYLSLLQIDGEWKIVNKIWNAEPREPR